MSSKRGTKEDAADLAARANAAASAADALPGVPVSELSSHLDPLLSLEKQCRLSGDTESTRRLALACVELTIKSGASERLREIVGLLARRRGQHKSVVMGMVERATKAIDEIGLEGGLAGVPEPDQEREKLIAMLREVTEGRIYCEVERARLTMRLSKMKESRGDLKGAASVLQEVQVETYGAMERREKAEFLLEQIRMCLDTGDNVRTELISKKMTAKVLDEELFQDIRVRYFELMIRFHLFRKDHLAVARDYRAIFRTSAVQADPAQWHPALKKAVVHAVLAPFDKDQQELIALLAAEKKRIGDLPAYARLASYFTTDEVTPWPEVRALFDTVLPADHPDLFSGDAAEANWEAFQTSVVRHNIRVVSLYYSRINTGRLAEMLHLDADATERHLSEMVVGGKVFARIDRPAGVVSFAEPRSATTALNAWASDVSRLLGLVDRACHIASMEVQNHSSRAKLAGKAK